VGDMRVCFFCSRNVEDDLTVAADFGMDVGIRSVCHTCWERGEEAATWRDDDEEDEAA
jgi:hypothetical protein